MSDLPPGWEWATLGEVLERIEAGKSFSGDGRSATPGEWGVIKVSAMTYGQFREGENKAVRADTAFSENAEIKPGDLLLSRANTRDYVGASVLVDNCRPRLLLSDKSLRLIPTEAVDRRWLWYALQSPTSRQYMSNASSGVKAGMRNVSQASLRAMPLSIPPVAEQCRIVAALEENLSRLDAGTVGIEAGRGRLNTLTKRVIIDAIPTLGANDCQWVTVGKAGRVDLGRQRHPDWHTGQHMRPYLRVANVFEDRIDLGDVMEMDFPSEVFERFKVNPGDILLNEGQSPQYLGRPAMYRGDPDKYAFTNSLIRFRARPDVLPEWALLVFRRHMHARRFIQEVRITTNIAHLSATRFKSVEFPIPPLRTQKRIVDSTNEILTDITRMGTALNTGRRHSDQLRRAILTDAFTGRLVPQDPSDEPASALLERVRAARPAQTKRGRRIKQTDTTQGTLL